MGRKPIGKVAMTDAQRQRRRRRKAKREARTARLPTSQWGTLRPIDGTTWQDCYRRASDRPPPSIEGCQRAAEVCFELARGWSEAPPYDPVLNDADRKLIRALLRRLPIIRANAWRIALPTRDDPRVKDVLACEWVEPQLRQLLDRNPRNAPDWTDLANYICAYGMEAWRTEAGRPVSTSKPTDPLCGFVHAVLVEMGMGKSLDAVVHALRYRRGRRAREK